MNRLACAALLALSFAACAPSSDPTPEDYLGVDLEDLVAAELAPDVAQAAALSLDDSLLATPAASRFVSDATLAADADVAALVDTSAAVSDASTSAHSLREVVVAVRWGYFPARPADEWVDWSGFVAISRGEVELIRPLRFENDHDGDARPHEDFVHQGADRRVVRFRSHTRPAWDGLLLRVRRPTLGPAVLVIHAGGVTRVLAFEELYDLDAAETVDAAGHQLKLRAHALAAAHPCIDEVALAHGEWHGDDMSGTLRGTLDAPGGPVAMLGQTLDRRGPYGLVRVELSDPDSGARVGGARGIYAGFHYAPGGVLAARVRDAADELRGALAGRFADGSFTAHVLQRDPACAAANFSL